MKLTPGLRSMRSLPRQKVQIGSRIPVGQKCLVIAFSIDVLQSNEVPVDCTGRQKAADRPDESDGREIERRERIFIRKSSSDERGVIGLTDHLEEGRCICPGVQ